MRVFIDSDVVVSSLLSSIGAASFLLSRPQSGIQPTISSLSYTEIQNVCRRLDIQSQKFKNLVKHKLEVVNIAINMKRIKAEYKDYVTDINDAHIVAGARIAKAKYLISYNLRHFRADKIKSDMDILLMTPAIFLQFLRSNA